MCEEVMEELYEMIAEEERQFEKWREENPCCANCKYYDYDDSTGADLCGYYGDCVCIDEDKTICETKCESWK